MRPRIFDTFMFNDELDMLECRLYELEDVSNLIHVAVEADVDHQDHRKPYHLTENLGRFDQWKDRLVIVRASGLPTHAEDPDPWAREHAQREHAAAALRDADPDDVVLHGDLDEIPTELVARNIRPQGFVALEQTLYCFAVDWLHPERWRGTVAARVKDVKTFGQMRDVRNIAKPLQNAGWHLSWLGGKDAALRKLGSFCHPEIAGRTLEGIESGQWLNQGWHVDGKKMVPVDVDGSWPRWIAERKCPESWFRPRDVEQSRWRPPTGLAS